MADSQVIRVMIVDDHSVVREGITGFLSAFNDLQLVGEAANGREALALVAELQPNVILMDLVMPGMDGVATTQTIRATYPHIQVIILTSFHDEDSVRRGLEAGAIGYLLKNASIHDMANTIRAAYAGKLTLAPEAAQALVSAKIRPAEPHYNLKDRELEVLRLMVKGLNNPDIAEQLFLSRSTVKFYVSSILAKLSAESRTEAVAIAIDHGLVSRED